MDRRVENVLRDGVGYVELVDTMGDQYTPAEDARMSTGKGRLGPEKDAALQESLARRNHTSPFEGVILKFELCVPLFVLREIDRHRTTGKVSDEDVEVVTPEESSRKWFARNEMSGRYVQMPDQYYYPDHARPQRSTQDVDPDAERRFLQAGRELTRAAREVYDAAVAAGVERGQARIFNTQNQYTRVRMTGSLKNWLDFLALRLPPDVLTECRWVAEAMLRLVESEYPGPVATWRRHVLDAVRLSSDEAEALSGLLSDLLRTTRVENFVKQVEGPLKRALGKLEI